jgi:hypothetical protein
MSRRTCKRLIVVLILNGWIPVVFAVAPGFYMGLMGGLASNTSSPRSVLAEDLTTTLTANPRSNQYGARLFLGYKMNRYAGVEAGLFTFFTPVNYTVPDNTQPCSGLNTRTGAVDVVGKGTLPFSFADYSFDIFGKAGAALTYVTTSKGLNSSPSRGCGKKNYEGRIRPALTIGASYDLSQSWVADLSWTRLMTGGIAKNMDLYALGISYHFVDQYCGQFLCN